MNGGDGKLNAFEVV